MLIYFDPDFIPRPPRIFLLLLLPHPLFLASHQQTTYAFIVYRTHTPSASLFSLQLCSSAAAPEPLAYAAQWSLGESQNRYCEPPLLPRLVLAVTALLLLLKELFQFALPTRCRAYCKWRYEISSATRPCLYASTAEARFSPLVFAINISGGRRKGLRAKKKKNANRIYKKKSKSEIRSVPRTTSSRTLFPLFLGLIPAPIN